MGPSEVKLKAKLLSRLVNFKLKFWYIEEVGNTLAMSIVSSAVCGIFRETSMNILVHQGSQFELRAKLNREPLEFPEYQSNPSIFSHFL